MAVKKSLTPSVDSDAVETIDNAPESEPVEVTESVQNPSVEDTPPVVEVQPPALEVTPAEPDETKIPEVEQNVKIRLRVDHRCCIALERYDFKAGKVYNVPPNVKRILNNAGLLAPL